MARKNNRSFKNIRRIAADIYTYGFRTREDFTTENAVGNDKEYDNIIRQLRDLYYYDVDSDDSPLQTDTANRGKYKCYQFKRDYFACDSDYLAASFGLCTAGDEEAVTLLMRCLSFAAKPEGVTVAQLNAVTTEDGRDRRLTYDRKLRDLCQTGYLRKSKTSSSKGTRFFLADGLSKLNDNQLTWLYYLVSFYAGAGYPRTPAIFIKNALKRQFYYRKIAVPPDAFLFRDNICGNVLDEDIVYQLMERCQKHHEVTVLTGKDKALTIQPVYLKIDTRMGRWYLFGVCEGYAKILRVSNIKEIIKDKTAEAIAFDYEQAKNIVGHSLCNSYVSGSTHKHSVWIEAELHFDDPFLREQFEREIVIGRIEKVGEQEYYRVLLTDVLEIKPLLRSYAAYVKILPSNGHRLAEELRSEYEGMLKNYETL